MDASKLSSTHHTLPLGTYLLVWILDFLLIGHFRTTISREWAPCVWGIYLQHRWRSARSLASWVFLRSRRVSRMHRANTPSWRHIVLNKWLCRRAHCTVVEMSFCRMVRTAPMWVHLDWRAADVYSALVLLITLTQSYWPFYTTTNRDVARIIWAIFECVFVLLSESSRHVIFFILLFQRSALPRWHLIVR